MLLINYWSLMHHNLLLAIMSFFNKIFGGGEQKAKSPPPPPPKSKEQETNEKKIKIEKALNELEIKIQAFQEKEKKYEHKIDTLKAKAKDLILADKKKDAKKYIQQATKVQKQLESYTLRRKVLVDKKFQLDQAVTDMDTINIMDDTNEHLKDQEKYSQKLQDIILDGAEAKMRQKQIDDKLKDMVEDDDQDEAVDEMFNDLMKEVNAEKKKPQKTVNVNVNIAPAAKNVQKNKKAEEDEIQMMLNNL